jgi:hypothetical protein
MPVTLAELQAPVQALPKPLVLSSRGHSTTHPGINSVRTLRLLKPHTLLDMTGKEFLGIVLSLSNGSEIVDVPMNAAVTSLPIARVL